MVLPWPVERAEARGGRDSWAWFFVKVRHRRHHHDGLGSPQQGTSRARYGPRGSSDTGAGHREATLPIRRRNAGSLPVGDRLQVLAHAAMLDGPGVRREQVAWSRDAKVDRGNTSLIGKSGCARSCMFEAGGRCKVMQCRVPCMNKSYVACSRGSRSTARALALGWNAR